MSNSALDTRSVIRRLRAALRTSFREIEDYVLVRRDLPAAHIKAWGRRLVLAACAGIVVLALLIGAATLFLTGIAGLACRLVGDPDWGRLITGVLVIGLLMGALALYQRRQARKELTKLQEKYQP